MSDSTIVEQSSRYRVVEFPTALPGHCFGCRKHKGPFIDTGIQEDFLGAIYWCHDCVAEMARNFGFITPDQAHDLKTQLNIANQDNIDYLESIGDLEEENVGLRRALTRSSGSPTVQSDSDSTVDEKPTGKEGSGTPENDIAFFQTTD